VPALPLTAQQREQLDSTVGDLWALGVNAFLLTGQYAQALHAAQMQTLSQGAQRRQVC